RERVSKDSPALQPPPRNARKHNTTASSDCSSPDLGAIAGRRPAGAPFIYPRLLARTPTGSGPGTRLAAPAALVLPHYPCLMHGWLAGLTLLLFLLRHGCFRQADRLQAHLLTEDIQFVLLHLAPAADRHFRSEEHRPETHPSEPIDPHTLGFPQAAHLAVASFRRAYVEPAVDACATGADEVGGAGRAVCLHHPFLQTLEPPFVVLAHDPHRILAVHLPGGVHQPVGQLAIGGEQQQAGGIDIQSANVDPAALLQAR